MKIKNINGLSAFDLQQEVKNGGRFVYYAYTVSLLIITFKRTSGVYLVKQAEKSSVKGLPFTIISFLFGWWGIPFGPKYTVESILTNMRGGKDVTEEIMATVAGFIQFEETEQRRKAV